MWCFIWNRFTLPFIYGFSLQAHISSCVNLLKKVIFSHSTKWLYVPFVFQMGSKSGKWRPLWTKTKHKLWVHFQKSALCACINPEAISTFVCTSIYSEICTNLNGKQDHTPKLYVISSLKPASCNLIMADSMWCFFFFFFPLIARLEHAFCWGPPLSRPVHLPPS